MAVTNLLFCKAAVSACSMLLGLGGSNDALSATRSLAANRVAGRWTAAGDAAIELEVQSWRCALLRIADAPVAKVICL